MHHWWNLKSLFLEGLHFSSAALTPTPGIQSERISICIQMCFSTSSQKVHESLRAVDSVSWSFRPVLILYYYFFSRVEQDERVKVINREQREKLPLMSA